MAYSIQNFKDGDVLKAEHLNHIEQYLYKISLKYEELIEKIINLSKISEVTLKSSDWVGDNNLYSQIVNIDGITENSQIDLTPSVEQLLVFYEKDLTFVVENEDGVVTVHCIGQKPQNDYTIQVTITEVAYE